MQGSSVECNEFDVSIKNICTDKVRYNPSSDAVISINVKNNSGEKIVKKLNVDIFQNETKVYSTTKIITLNAEQNAAEDITWNTPKVDNTGYIVKAYLDTDDFKTTALDVCSNWSVYPRYGYIPNFDKSITLKDIQSQIKTLTSDYYLNAFQFYDWMWRHETPIKRVDGQAVSNWSDLFDRDIQMDVVKNYIKAVQDKNAKAMAYMMSYAAREDYEKYGISKSSGIFKDQNHEDQFNVDFNNGRYLWLFAPTDLKWQKLIGNSYVDCINTLGFDGIQMDQMGQRDNVYDYNGKSYDLQNSFSSLINSVKKRMLSNNPNKSYVDFNIVDGVENGWAENDVSKNADTDFNFSEMWWKANGYNDIKKYIEQVRQNSKGKALVLAGYMNYKDNSGERYEAEDAKYSSSVDVASNHVGYTGKGFIENFAKIGDYVEFTISVDRNMNYPLVFQYGDNCDEATRTVYIDGVKTGKLNFYPQNTWDKFVFESSCNAKLSAGTHKVKISYDNDDKGAINLDSMTVGMFNEPSIRLADAMMAACGATHIELGAGKDGVSMLPHEYYPNTSKIMSEKLSESMKSHYKFITAYEKMLFSSDINPGDTGNQMVSIDGQNVSGDGQPGSIWHINRSSSDYEIMHLINLSNQSNNDWRSIKNVPDEKKNIQVKQYLPKNANVSGVYLASPDFNECATMNLSYTQGKDESGYYVAYTVPELKYWDMIYIKRTIETPDNGVYEAEDAVKSNVSINTNHTGYTGSGFVDKFAEKGDEVTFQINAVEAKNYDIAVRYANSTGYSATRHVYVDGKYIGTVKMSSLNNWDCWAESAIKSFLGKGIHTISIYYDESDDHGINLDSIKIY